MTIEPKRLPNNSVKSKVLILLPENYLQKIRRDAKKRGLNVSAWIRRAIEEKLV